MYLQIDTLNIRLSSDSPALQEHWAAGFAGWISPGPAPDSADDPLSLHLDVRRELPAPPSASPLFVDPQQRVIVYEPTPGYFHLRFPAGAHVQVTVAAGEEQGARGVILPQLVGSPLLADLLYTSLSPLLRRRHYFLMHAAAVRSPSGKAALFVGPSQSGKTTSSLALFLAGWPYLASDVVLLSEGEDGVYACPTPGEIHVRPYTFTLLPGLQRYVGEHVHSSDASLTLPLSQWAKPASVEAVYFPELGSGPRSQLSRLPQTVALARLLEESADRWDSACLEAHLQFLAALTRQATGRRLQLAHKVIDLPQLLDPCR